MQRALGRLPPAGTAMSPLPAGFAHSPQGRAPEGVDAGCAPLGEGARGRWPSPCPTSALPPAIAWLSALLPQVALTTSDWDEASAWLTALKRLIKTRQMLG